MMCRCSVSWLVMGSARSQLSAKDIRELNGEVNLVRDANHSFVICNTKGTWVNKTGVKYLI